jgi:ADP-dependent NAD(P)H-hydrate dehydratase / NAD(P)H-hydrate epimerase
MVKKHISKIGKRKIDTNKKDFGHVFVIAGSIGMTGAAYLTSEASMLSGSGLVTCGIPKSLNSIMEVKLTEPMTLPLPETKDISLSTKAEKEIIRFSKKTDVLAIGPGISKNKDTQKLVRNLLKKINKPIVLDADGIISLVNNGDLLNKRKSPTILTPHPGEFSKIVSKDIATIQAIRTKIASNFARKHKVILVLKGQKTVVAGPKGEIYVNTTGNSGMSTAGTGDVLTGMISSFIGQGIDPYGASVIGVYIHGLAGDLAAKEKGHFSLIASDLLKQLPKAIRDTI